MEAFVKTEEASLISRTWTPLARHQLNKMSIHNWTCLSRVVRTGCMLFHPFSFSLGSLSFEVEEKRSRWRMKRT